MDAKFKMMSSEVDESLLTGTSPPFFWPLLSVLEPCDESDCCFEYTTGGGELSFPVAPAELATDLGELLPLLLDFGVDSGEGFWPAGGQDTYSVGHHTCDRDVLKVAVVMLWSGQKKTPQGLPEKIPCFQLPDFTHESLTNLVLVGRH